MKLNEAMFYKVRDFSCPAPLGWMKSKVKQSPVGLWFADKRNPELEIKALARGERSSTGKQGFYFTFVYNLSVF